MESVSRTQYLFYDTEFANSFGGIHKLCSFGYILTDTDFNMIKNEEYIMDPEEPFCNFSPCNTKIQKIV